MSRRAQWVSWVLMVAIGGAGGVPAGYADTSEPSAPEALELQPAEAAPVADAEPVGMEEEALLTPAEEAPSVEETPSVAVPEAAGTAGAPAPSATGPSAAPGAGLVSVDFKDADIRQVLRILSLKSGVDIVAGNDVEGLVTIKLTNIPWEQALDIILRTYGFTYERKGNIVRVLTLESLEQEALSTEVFPLSYAKAAEVPDVVNEMLSDRGRIKFDERTNTVIVTDIPSTLFQIKQVVERLDQRTPQVLIETKVVETRLEKNEKLGIDWSDSWAITTTPAQIPTTFPFPMRSGLGAFGETFVPRAGTFDPDDGSPFLNGTRIPVTGGEFTFGTIGAGSLSTTLNMLKRRTDTKIVSNPSISVLDNQEAKVHVGSEFPIPNYTVDPTTGRTTITGYTARTVGTILAVTPHVNQSKEIVANLKPEVIASAGTQSYSTGSGNSVTLPIFTVQTAQTQVRLKDGETVAIGGLVKEGHQTVQDKVPFLGDIPILGMLFTNESKDQANSFSDPQRQDLMIFVTMALIDEDGRAAAAQVAAVSEMAAEEPAP